VGTLSTSKRPIRRRSLRGVGMTLMLVLGLLLWARLKLVTDTPRMVYADPKISATDGPSDAGQPGTPNETPGSRPINDR
jgi:hypothetical protein